MRRMRTPTTNPQAVLPAVLGPGPRSGKGKRQRLLGSHPEPPPCTGAAPPTVLADMLSTRGAATTPPRTRGRRGRPRKPPPPAAARPTERCVQMHLFDGLRRDYSQFNEREDTNPENPWLAWGLHLA